MAHPLSDAHARESVRANPVRGVCAAGPALRSWRLATLTAMGVFFLTRTVLLIQTGRQADLSLTALIATFAQGLVTDALVAALLAAPFLVMHALVPARWLRRAPLRALHVALIGLYVFSLLFFAVAELLFWREFGTRFNFIAVDYLIYTQEVIGNIRESYPVGIIIASLAAGACVVAWLLRRRLGTALAAQPAGWRGLASGLLALLLPCVGLMALAPLDVSRNAYNNELSDNGWRTFASALHQNRLDYQRFYATLPVADVEDLLHTLAPHPLSLLSGRPPALQPAVLAPSRTQLPNVVLITVESLSADFLGSFGNTRGLTPNLDRLAAEGLLFTRLYATGTRTVRGLEALSIALPPTPGQSVVKRPANQDLYTLGSVLARHDYKPYFIYGGYGYFDNMNAYFAGNGYQVVDRTSFQPTPKRFENIWGVADEYLFDEVAARLDAETGTGHRVFAHVMTTSNHRPYTYPDGRIDIASPGGRKGAVKYTDYAIGRFIATARSRPWFRNTVFVIVADHCASSAGKTRLPLTHYHIPAIIYAPGIVSPARIDRLASQIDLVPTLLGLLGIEPGNHFLGRDILAMRASDERTFISTYQELGYLRDGVLTVLSPRKQVSAYRVREGSDDALPIPVVPQLEREAIAYYQGADLLLQHHGHAAR